MPKSDLIRIRHMVDAAREALRFADGHGREDLDENRLLALGLLKCVEIIGEAAANVSLDLRSRHPVVPWSDIVGMRNRLVHVYFDVDLDMVWETV